MKKTLILMAGMLLIAGSVMAQQAPAPGNDDAPQMGVPQPQMPALTDDQQKALDQERLAHAKEMIPLEAQLKVLRMELRELIGNGESAKGVAKKQDEINKLQAKIAESRNNHIVKIRDIVGVENFKLMADRMLDGRPGRGMMDRPMRGAHPGMGPNGWFDDDDAQGKPQGRRPRPNCIRPDNPGSFWDSF